jgi:hypothetical protein
MRYFVYAAFFSLAVLDAAAAPNYLTEMSFGSRTQNVTKELKEGCTAAREIIVSDMSTRGGRGRFGFVRVYDIFLNFEDGVELAYSNYSSVHTKLFRTRLAANLNRCLKSVTVRGAYSRFNSQPLGSGKLAFWYQ